MYNDADMYYHFTSYISFINSLIARIISAIIISIVPLMMIAA